MIGSCTTGANLYRTYGQRPCRVVAIHGGPGTPGSLGYLSRKLSRSYGVLEPFQSAHTISGQAEELHSIVISECESLPVNLIGHSWGAWLALVLAARYPAIVAKIILIGAGAFDDKYNLELGRTRTDRLNDDEKAELIRLTADMKNPATALSDVSAFARFGELTNKSDSYRCVDVDDTPIAFQPDVYRSVWKEAEEMRRSGELLGLAANIRCPVIAIHGDYDPHPAEGVRERLRAHCPISNSFFSIIADITPGENNMQEINSPELLTRNSTKDHRTRTGSY